MIEAREERTLDENIVDELKKFKYPKDMLVYGICRVRQLMKHKGFTYKEATAYHIAKETE